MGARGGRRSLADSGKQRLGRELFHAALPALSAFTSPRAWAFGLLGIDEYLRAYQGERDVQSARSTLASRLVDIFERTSDREWQWFEDRATYDNARLSQALLVSGSRTGNERMLAIGLRSLEWLVSVQRSEAGYFAPIGSNGFAGRGEVKADYDQQPVEACSMVAACLEARRITGEASWLEHAHRALGWFFGQNHLHRTLCDVATGGCRDALHVDRANENQGAESTLSFQLALLDMHAAQGGRTPSPAARQAQR